MSTEENRKRLANIMKQMNKAGPVTARGVLVDARDFAWLIEQLESAWEQNTILKKTLAITSDAEDELEIERDELKAKADKLADLLKAIKQKDGQSTFPNPILQKWTEEALKEWNEALKKWNEGEK